MPKLPKYLNVTNLTKFRTRFLFLLILPDFSSLFILLGRLSSLGSCRAAQATFMVGWQRQAASL